MKQALSGIYALVVQTDDLDMIYIGSSVNVYQRIAKHKTALIRNKHFNQYLQNLLNKYKQCYILILELFQGTELELRQLEQLWLDEIPENQRINLGPILPSANYKHGMSGTLAYFREANKRSIIKKKSEDPEAYAKYKRETSRKSQSKKKAENPEAWAEYTREAGRRCRAKKKAEQMSHENHDV